MTHEAFTSGHFDTKFVETYFTPAVLQTNQPEEELLIASLLSVRSMGVDGTSDGIVVETKTASLWKKNRLA